MKCERPGNSILGSGDWAVISTCWGAYTVRLSQNSADAYLLAEEPCGMSECTFLVKRHDVVFIDLVNQSYVAPVRRRPTPVTSSYHPNHPRPAEAISGPANHQGRQHT